MPSLASAYERVRRDNGCAGTDGQTVWDFAAGLEENLRLLREELLGLGSGFSRSADMKIRAALTSCIISGEVCPVVEGY